MTYIRLTRTVWKVQKYEQSRLVTVWVFNTREEAQNYVDKLKYKTDTKYYIKRSRVRRTDILIRYHIVDTNHETTRVHARCTDVLNAERLLQAYRETFPGVTFKVKKVVSEVK